MNLHAALHALLVLAATIVLGPILAVRTRLPAPVVLIVLGIAVGPVGLGWVHADGAVAFVAELGFLVLMFVAGMEIDFASLRRAGIRALIAPVLTVLGVFAASIAFGAALHLRVIDVLALSAMSVGMPLAVLHEAGALQTPLGRHVLLTTSIGEFASIIALTGFEVFAHDHSAPERIERIAKVVLLFVVAATLIRWARAVVWWHPERFSRLVIRDDVAEIGVRTGILLLFGFVVLASVFGVEAILGAFMAGALLSFVLHEKRTLEGKIAALGQGLFIPIFFVVVGVRFEPRRLDRAALRDAAVLFALATIVKLVPALIFAGRGLGARQRLAAGTLFAAPLTLVVAIGAIGRELGVLDARREATLVLLAVVLSVLFPIGFRVLARPPSGSPSLKGLAAGP